MGGHGPDLFGSECEPFVDSYELWNEHQGSVIYGECLKCWPLTGFSVRTLLHCLLVY